MKIINRVKKYLAHCYEINTNEKTRVYWSMGEFELAEHLCRMGGMCIISGKGYFYDFHKLKKTLKKVGLKTLRYYYNKN